MSDLRPLRPVCKIVGYAGAIAVVLTVVGTCWADEAAAKPAPVGFSGLPDKSSGDITGMMWQMLAAALMVVAIGGVALFVVKRLLPKIRQTSHKRISVLETAYLGSRKAVHLLQVGSRKILVASSSEGVVRLDDVTSAFSPEYADIALRIGAETNVVDRPGDPREADENA